MLCDCRTLTGMICYIRESDLHLYLQWYVITCISITLWCSHLEMSFITTQVFCFPQIVVSFYLLLLLLHLCQHNFSMWYPFLHVWLIRFKQWSFLSLTTLHDTDTVFMIATNQHLSYCLAWNTGNVFSEWQNIANCVLLAFHFSQFCVTQLCCSGVSLEIETQVLIMFGSCPFID